MLFADSILGIPFQLGLACRRTNMGETWVKNKETTKMKSSTEIHSFENKNRILVEKEFMIRTLIIVDDAMIADLIRKVAGDCCPNLELAGNAGSIKTGISLVNEKEPDLLILDTRLSDGSGFDLLRQFEKPDFKIIFISSKLEFAAKAIKFNAIDYLLKPLEKEELTLAFNKAVESIRFEESLHQKALGKSLANVDKTKRLVLKASDQVHMVNIPDIVRIEASNNYSTFHMSDGRNILISKSLKEYETLLLDHGFHRIHKSHIFNMNHMSHLDKVDGGYIVMFDGSRIPVASRKREILLELFEGIK